MSELIKAGHRWVLRLSEAEKHTLQEGARHHPHPQARERCAALRHPSRQATRRIGWPNTDVAC